jgi:RNA polymerase sigma factor (sigma-70 family)
MPVAGVFPPDAGSSAARLRQSIFVSCRSFPDNTHRMQLQLTNESSLLRDFAHTQSDRAFRSLVDRYIHLVFASARRQTGDAHLAEDVTQAVFILLAQKAPQIPTDRPLSAWLLRTTSYCAANARRTRRRRMQLESRAIAMSPAPPESHCSRQPEWDRVSPLLDEGLSRLRQKDRDVLLWRFFESRSVLQIAAALGISEHAASKRVSRAVDRLRDFFARRGVTVSSVALGTMLVTKVTEAAPAALVDAVSAAATVGAGASAAAIAKGAAVMAAATKVKLTAAAAVAALLLVGGTATVVSVMASQEQGPAAPAGPPAQAAAEPPAGATEPRAATTAPASASIRFPDGTVATIIAIAEGHERAVKWWAADGAPAADPGGVGAGVISVAPSIGRRELQLVIDVVGQAMQDKTFTVAVPQSSGTATTSIATPQGRRYRIAIAMPAAATVADLRLGLAGGAFHETLLWENGAPIELDPDNPAPKMLEMREENGQAVLEFARGFGPAGQDRRVVVISGGRTIYSSGSNSSTRRETYRFGIPMNQITKVIFRTRPFEWQEMRNVSLMPGDH